MTSKYDSNLDEQEIPGRERVVIKKRYGSGKFLRDSLSLGDVATVFQFLPRNYIDQAVDEQKPFSLIELPNRNQSSCEAQRRPKFFESMKS